MSTIEDLIEYRKKLVESGLTEDDLRRISEYIKIDDIKNKEEDNGTTNKEEKGYAYTKTIPGVPRFNEDENTNGIFNQAGFSNAIFLSTLTLICEVTFFVLAVLIYS